MSTSPVQGQYSPEAELAMWWRGLFQPNQGLTQVHQRELAAETEPGWQQDASCAQADPEAWFPGKGHFATRQVLATCAHCPVRRACLAAALLRDEHGIWAGTTLEQRREIYRLLKAGVPVVEVLDDALAHPEPVPDAVQGAA